MLNHLGVGDEASRRVPSSRGSKRSPQASVSISSTRSQKPTKEGMNGEWNPRTTHSGVPIWSPKCALWRRRWRRVPLYLTIRFLYTLRERHWRRRSRGNTTRERGFLSMGFHHLNRLLAHVSSVSINQRRLESWQPFVDLWIWDPSIRSNPDR